MTNEDRWCIELDDAVVDLLHVKLKTESSIESDEYRELLLEYVRDTKVSNARVLSISQGVVTSLAVLIRPRGTFGDSWFDKYKDLVIGTLIIEDNNTETSIRNDKYINDDFPKDKSIVDRGDNPFILNIKYLGIGINNSINESLKFNLNIISLHTYPSIKPIIFTGEVIFSRSLHISTKIYKNNVIQVKLSNTDVKLELGIVDAKIKDLEYEDTQYKLPFFLKPGDEVNLVYRVKDEEFQNTFTIFIKWNVKQSLFDREYLLWTVFNTF